MMLKRLCMRLFYPYGAKKRSAELRSRLEFAMSQSISR